MGQRLMRRPVPAPVFDTGSPSRKMAKSSGARTDKPRLPKLNKRRHECTPRSQHLPTWSHKRAVFPVVQQPSRSSDPPTFVSQTIIIPIDRQRFVEREANCNTNHSSFNANSRRPSTSISSQGSILQLTVRRVIWDVARRDDREGNESVEVAAEP